MKKNKSQCPINQTLEIIGDKWTLLIIRDIMFHGKRHFREFLGSDENISTNILTERLNMLEELGIVVKTRDDHHKQKKVYTLTYKGIGLIPVVFEIALWFGPFASLTETNHLFVRELQKGGKELQHKMKTDLSKEINDLFKSDDDLFLSYKKKFYPLVITMSDLRLFNN